MKKITLALLTIVMAFLGTKVSAQGKYGADSANCIKYLSYYQEYYKQKNYDEALPNWRKAYSVCPATASENMLIHGSTLMQKQIVKAMKDPALRKARIDSLLEIQDKRAAAYPKHQVSAFNNKGQYAINYYNNDNESLHSILSDIIEQLKENTKASIFTRDLQAIIDLYKDGKISAEDVITAYENYAALIAATDQTKDENVQAKAGLDQLFGTSGVASCDNLLAIYTPRYEANPDDMDLVNQIVKMMGRVDGCQKNNDLYMKAAIQSYNNNPSSTSAYYLYKLNSVNDNPQEAVKYLKEAISYDDIDASTKAEYQIQLATYCNSNNMTGEAYAAAEAAAKDPSTRGQAYLIMGSIWMKTSCGGNEVTSKAKFWVASDFFQKAKAADESLSATCNQLIGQCSAYFPEKADAFMYDIVSGQSYSVNCGGMHATTTVRTR